MRLIDADALKERWTIASPAPYSIWDAAEVLDTINEAPTVDAVEVVRCGECLYSRALDRSDRHEDEYIEGCLWCNLYGIGKLPEEYCSDGECGKGC